MMFDAKLQVLIAEDDDGHATLVRRNLKRAGIEELVHLRDGQELLDYVYRRAAWADRASHESMVLVLDLNMPRLGGLDVLRVLRNDADRVPFPVFVLTTTDNPAEIYRCYSLGAAACLVKPVDYGAFGGMIQRLGAFLVASVLPGEHRPSGVVDQ